jgi:adenylosuccinate synthase
MLELRDFIERGRASVIVGAQFGSEAKGLAAGIVAHHASVADEHIIATTNAGAQAGHTTVIEDGNKFVCYHLPTIGVLRPGSMIYLNAGSIIDPHLLMEEIVDISYRTGESVDVLSSRIHVHPAAAIIKNEDREREWKETAHLGSTRKGVGAALSNKIMRQLGSTARESQELRQVIGGRNICAFNLMKVMDQGKAITIEIPQGTGLSINHNMNFWPRCTSRDCWVMQGLTDAGIHARYLYKTMMVQRTFPIRVGHIMDENNQIIGHSGSFYLDSAELKWSDLASLGVQPEYTTVTKRQRRIATFSANQYYDSLVLNQPDIVLNTFMNYLHPNNVDNYSKTLIKAESWARIHPTHIASMGPKVSDTYEFDPNLVRVRQVAV